LTARFPDTGQWPPAAVGRFLTVDVGLRLILLVGGLVSADRLRVSCVAVHTAIPGNVVVGEPAS